MRIQFERSGGFAGMLVQATVDTNSLPPPEAGNIVDLVEDANFFNLPAQISSSSPGADQFQYKLTVEEGDRCHTVETSEGAVPDSLRPLLRQLTLRARSS